MTMKIKNSRRDFFIILIVVFCFCLAAGIYSLSRLTLISFTVTVVYFAVAAFASGIVMWRCRLWTWLTGSSAFLPNYLCHSVCTGIFVIALFYICNYCFSDDEAGHIEKTVVENKYYKVRHKTRRVSRGRYTRGEAYSVYYLKVRFSEGSFTDLQVKYEKYARLYKGDTVELFISEGFFGYPVVKYSKIDKYTRVSSYRQSH